MNFKISSKTLIIDIEAFLAGLREYDKWATFSFFDCAKDSYTAVALTKHEIVSA